MVRTMRHIIRKVGEVNEVGEIKLDVERIKKTPIRRLVWLGRQEWLKRGNK